MPKVQGEGGIPEYYKPPSEAKKNGKKGKRC